MELVGLTGDIDADVLPGTDAAEDAARMVGLRSPGVSSSPCSLSALRYAVKTCVPISPPLRRWCPSSRRRFRHRGGRTVRPSRRGHWRFNMQLRADGIQRRMHAVHIVFQLGTWLWLAAKRFWECSQPSKPDFSPTWVTWGGDFRAEFFSTIWQRLRSNAGGGHLAWAPAAAAVVACRICANRYSRHGWAENFGRCCRSLAALVGIAIKRAMACLLFCLWIRWEDYFWSVSAALGNGGWCRV